MKTASGDNRHKPELEQDAPLESRRGRFIYVLLVLVPLLVLIPVFLSFLSFAHHVGTVSSPDDPRADAIVVLTGGTERVERAVALLSEGRAMRLLISGVHPGTTPEQIASITSAEMPLFDCCVDLDRLAMNTTGNASQTAAWVRSNGFKSLLVVTSAYHIPRALVELGESLPGVLLLPYPVYPSSLDLQSWYLSPKTSLLLMREYVKYTLARLRIFVTHAMNI
ncbi:YdcF family protein [Roseibium algae]|uniref:YdcF family protein n=1 Tax=Roseibium algae TaxID=3123038 RepID=A0ABU8TL61_9HYPH